MEAVVNRYASALFSAASKAKLLPKIRQEMENFHRLTTIHPPLAHLLSNPTIDTETKQQLLNEVLKSKKFSPIYSAFIELLVERRRLPMFSQIYSAFLQLIREAEGEINVHISTAIPIPPETMEHLRKIVVNSFTSKEQKVNFDSSVDASLIGGFVVQVGDKTLDLSVVSRLRETEKEILLL